ncbi:hypothetical protein SacRon12I_00540 [Sulfolobus acidocaldarius Ron12/I]|nr:hypothetical protein SacRon12I_00540 [Sulfolobus acidocaldarius Ron12/I]
MTEPHENSITWRVSSREKMVIKKILKLKHGLNRPKLYFFHETFVGGELFHYCKYESELIFAYIVFRRESKKCDSFHLRFNLKGEVLKW